jgi:hypothetical protein
MRLQGCRLLWTEKTSTARAASGSNPLKQRVGAHGFRDRRHSGASPRTHRGPLWPRRQPRQHILRTLDSVDPLRGGFRLLITGPNGFEPTGIFAIDDEPAFQTAFSIRDQFPVLRCALSARHEAEEILSHCVSGLFDGGLKGRLQARLPAAQGGRLHATNGQSREAGQPFRRGTRSRDYLFNADEARESFHDSRSVRCRKPTPTEVQRDVPVILTPCAIPLSPTSLRS